MQQPNPFPSPNLCCRCVILAAAPADARWSPTRHACFPPAFRRTVRALLLCNHGLAEQHARNMATLKPELACTIWLDEIEALRLRAEADACAPPLPADALLDIVRCLAAQPLSGWMGR